MNINEADTNVSEEEMEKVDVITDEPIEETPAPEAETPETPTNVEEPAPEEPKIEEKDASTVSFAETLNSLTQNYWNNISFIKSIIITLKDQETSFNKEDVINILNSLSDDATIGIGMLAKASEIIDDSTKKLMDIGTEKAEEIVSEPASTDLE